MLYTLTYITQVSQIETIKQLKSSFHEEWKANKHVYFYYKGNLPLMTSFTRFFPHRWTLPKLDTSTPQRCDTLHLLCPPSGH